MRCALINSGFLEVTGDDRIDFVHGLVTADVRGLAVGSGTGALLLNHRGHALAQMTVIRLQDRLLLAVEDSMADMVRAEFDAHIIFDQVELRPASSISQIALPDGVLGPLPAGLTVLAQVARQRSAGAGIDLFLRGDGLVALTALEAAGSTVMSPAELDLERVRAGIASAVSDAGPGVLPQEAGLEHLVSYRKGCYLGQEIMARIEARGKLQRGLRRVRLDGEPSGQERDISAGGKRVGRLGTVARAPDGSWLALAVLRHDLAEGTELEVGGVGGRVTP